MASNSTTSHPGKPTTIVLTEVELELLRFASDLKLWLDASDLSSCPTHGLIKVAAANHIKGPALTIPSNKLKV